MTVGGLRMTTWDAHRRRIQDHKWGRVRQETDMDAYALIARLYDVAIEPFNAPMRAVARSVHPVPAGSVVLDVGCGTGAGLAEYARDGCAVIGADPSPAMLDQAREKLGPQADLRLITSPTLPVDDACADLVVISLVLHGLPREEAAGVLREARRALAPGGRMLITDFGTDGLRFPRGHAIRGLTAVAEVVAGPRHARASLAYLRAGGVAPLLADAGLVALVHRPSAAGSMSIVVAGPAEDEGAISE